MATYDVAYRSVGTWDDSTNTFTPVPVGRNESYPRSTTDGTGDGSYSSGETLTFSGGSVEEEFIYVGYYEDGFVAHDYLNYYYFSPSLQFFPSSFTVETQTPFPTCFLEGTMIATPDGERAVEHLVTGDLVLTADGRAVPVRWIGFQTIVTAFAERLHAFPVRIAAGSLGEGLPARDLLLSRDHAVMLDGVLVHAGALVNATTITQEAAMPARFRYLHVEIDAHALVLAEGVPAETFAGNVARRRFDNHAEHHALYGEGPPAIAEMDAPRVKAARQLPRSIRDRLAARAASLRPASTAA